MASLVYRYNQAYTGTFDADTTAAGQVILRTDTTAGSTPTNGDIWFNSGNNQLQYYEGPTRTESWTGTTLDFNTTGTTTTTGAITLSNDQTIAWSGLSEIGKLKNALMQIFQKVPKDLITNEADAKLVKAKAKSEKLLKEWLSPAEYQGLVNNGEIEIPSKFDDDVIFIVKKDPNEMVQVKKNGQNLHKLCMVVEDMEFPVGDQLLSKVALIKTDEKSFKEIAIRHG